MLLVVFSSLVVGVGGDCVCCGGEDTLLWPVLLLLKVPDISLRHLNWHALVVRLGKCDAISFHPSFNCSFRCLSTMSSLGSHDDGVFLRSSCAVGDVGDVNGDSYGLVLCMDGSLLSVPLSMECTEYMVAGEYPATSDRTCDIYIYIISHPVRPLKHGPFILVRIFFLTHTLSPPELQFREALSSSPD